MELFFQIVFLASLGTAALGAYYGWNDPDFRDARIPASLGMFMTAFFFALPCWFILAGTGYFAFFASGHGGGCHG